MLSFGALHTSSLRVEVIPPVPSREMSIDPHTSLTRVEHESEIQQLQQGDVKPQGACIPHFVLLEWGEQLHESEF
jgi:hypothetical protein